MMELNRIWNQYFDLKRSEAPAIFLVGVFLLLVLTKLVAPKSNFNQKNIFIPPPQQLKYFSFGLSEQVADSLWVRSLQDLDYCNEVIDNHRCRGESWLFRIYDVASDLSPHFRPIYSVGTLALSILVNDVEGAERLFDKGLEYFPNDWILLYRAAYHAIYETGNKPKAADYLVRAGRAGAPSWVFALAGRIYSDEGAVEMAERLLEEMQQTGQDEDIVERLREKIQSMRSKSSK